MLGTSIRPNTVTKMIKEKNFKTTLSDKSTFNYILHSDLFDFIMDEKNNGVINFLSKNNINLKRVNEIVKGNTIFGDYLFQTEMVDGIKTRTSDEVIERYKKII